MQYRIDTWQKDNNQKKWCNTYPWHELLDCQDTYSGTAPLSASAWLVIYLQAFELL